MLAIAYVVAMLALGDRLFRRFLPTHSVVHRLSAALLVGLLFSTWVTYISAAIFAGLDQPLLVGNAFFFALAVIAMRDLPRRLPAFFAADNMARLRLTLRREWPELAVLSGLMAIAAWLAFSTFGLQNGQLQIGNIVYSDFGSTTAITQSFATGSNFPTVYPHFAGEPIRYHFLFYFLAGNLAFLGLDPALSLNLLSVLTIGAMLGLVITLGRVLFRSLVVGWIGAGLFFFHGSLAWVGYVTSLPSLTAGLDTIYNRRDFLVSGLPYRGEEWGVWTLAIYANQRHFASGIGILLLVLIFLVARWRRRQRRRTAPLDGLEAGVAERPSLRQQVGELRGRGSETLGELRWRERLGQLRRREALGELRWHDVRAFAFCGLLLGALPMWNGAVFVAAAVILAALFVLMPDRRYMLVMAAVAALVSLPQLEFLRPSAGVNAGYPALHVGYTIDEPTPLKILAYMGFTFGPKLLLGGAALLMLRSLHWKVFVAASALVVLAFTVQFSAEVLVNHKFLNIWLIVLNLFAAYVLVRLWRARPIKGLMAGPALAAALVVVLCIGGVIDLMPFRNGNFLAVPYRGDPLVDWIEDKTRPDDVFLTDIVVHHPILVAGRSVYLGWTYYAWSAGYDMPPREALYRQMYTESDADLLVQLLRSNRIAYVVFDDDLRTRGFVEDPNEQVYMDNFTAVFEAADYKNIRIYAVP